MGVGVESGSLCMTWTEQNFCKGSLWDLELIGTSRSEFTVAPVDQCPFIFFERI
jgi:hypothetical protein